jgi:sigma-B regulation protein RsbU (phosphoserine phosphatase)
MILLIAGPAVLIYILILGISAVSQYSQSKQEVEQSMTRLASSYSARFDGELREAARIAETNARFLESGITVSDEQIYALLGQAVKQTPLVYGSCLAFEPGTRRPAPELFAPYVCRAPEGLRRVNIDQSVYDWYRDPKYTWYSRPKQLAHSVWSDPYFDKGAGNILMATYSATFHVGDKFGGVWTVDIDLPQLQKTVGKSIDASLDFVIIAADGRYVFHPDASRIMDRPFLDYIDPAKRRDMTLVAKQMLSGQTGATWLDGWETDEPMGVFFAPISSTGWVFVSRIPTETVLSSVRYRTLFNGAALIATLLLIAGCIYYAARRIAAPIAALQDGVETVSRGNLDARVDESASTTEVRSLAHSFNRMTADLRANVERLAIEKGARQKMERDLDIAREIQQGLLPTSKPDVPGYEISGWSCAANKAGGDYFDWQILSDGRILISVADVAGHGIGPALVAAVCRAYARATTKDADLGSFLDQLNDLLVNDMPAGRFITYVGVLLDPKQNQAQMISAGHGPLFRCIHSSGALVETIADGFPLGLVPQNEYGAASQFVLEAGDSVLLVTDGLFEWPNAEGESYGLPRLRQAVASMNSGTADAVIEQLYKQTKEFAGDIPQDDDVTIVVIRRLPA